MSRACAAVPAEALTRFQVVSPFQSRRPAISPALAPAVLLAPSVSACRKAVPLALVASRLAAAPGLLADRTACVCVHADTFDDDCDSVLGGVAASALPDSENVGVSQSVRRRPASTNMSRRPSLAESRGMATAPQP